MPHVTRTVRAVMPNFPRALRALVPYVLSCLTCFACLVPHVPRTLRVPMSLLPHLFQVSHAQHTLIHLMTRRSRIFCLLYFFRFSAYSVFFQPELLICKCFFVYTSKISLQDPLIYVNLTMLSHLQAVVRKEI